MGIIDDRYRNAGFKLTPQRLAILAYLDGNRTHPSAEEVYRSVSRRFPTMSFATVYNTLDMLRKHGMLTELSIEPGKKRFDPDTSEHHHLVCLRCKRVVDIQTALRPVLPERARSGFTVESSHVEFFGYCPACQTGQKSSKED